MLTMRFLTRRLRTFKDDIELSSCWICVFSSSTDSLRFRTRASRKRVWSMLCTGCNSKVFLPSLGLFFSLSLFTLSSSSFLSSMIILVVFSGLLLLISERFIVGGESFVGEFPEEGIVRDFFLLKEISFGLLPTFELDPPPSFPKASSFIFSLTLI